MNKNLDVYKQFEELVYKTMSFYFDLKREKPLSLNGLRYETDYIAYENNNKAILEIKLYKSHKINMNILITAIEKLKFKGNISGILNLVLIVSIKIDKNIKKDLEHTYQVSIIDIDNLLHLSKFDNSIYSRFFNLINTTTENENSIASDEYNIQEVFKKSSIISSFYSHSSKDYDIERKKGFSLINRLKALKSSKEYYRDYELLLLEILEFLFEGDLVGWHSQKSTTDDLNRFDLICRIDSDIGIWKLFTYDFKSRYLLFEFKNYSQKIKQTQIYTTEKYLFEKALRTVAIIISKKGADDGALSATHGVLRETGKLIINMNDADIVRMITMKLDGSDATEVIMEKVDDFLLRLSK
ncbi:hypothetical protein QE109_02330 [Fusibacter bizertensis]|uniref:Restriction endonuclease type IV Mrr domain-containing protein n=1 Tax=Fusibacter bizertensis TaxID=1488331 RepID=A0ABT6N974_9FIRM|nr:hypothetical protein [Fusibacter bizertensis]MDH8676964.1 hypothetical protein [Fusibacter bizertensis]